MYKNYLKRGIDFLLALILTPFVLLIIIIMAPIIFWEDRGPVFYNAVRRGKSGKTFKMFKLRSMYVNSPDLKNDDGSMFNSDRDPRVTKVGRFMRRTSIDEIPQILNVLIGDMSFIGPRPNLPSKKYLEMSLEEKKRLEVRPGITGYSQAYFRNAISQEEKYKNDLYYIEHLSLLMDLKVFFKTIETVLNQKNIYNTKEEKDGR